MPKRQLPSSARRLIRLPAQPDLDPFRPAPAGRPDRAGGQLFPAHAGEIPAGEATGLKDGGRVMLTDTGEVANDGLIIASGGRFMKKFPGIEHVVTPCEGVAAAVRIRDRVREMQSGTIAVSFGSNPNEPSAMRGGPMFEFLFGLHTQLAREGRRDRFKLVFFSPMKEPGKRLGDNAVKRLLAAMAARGVENHLGYKISDIPADLILFTPGMTGSTWFDNADLPRSPGGLLKADQYCRVEGCDKVYVAGDSGSFPGPDWMPKQAHLASLQASTAAANLLAELNGRAPAQTFKVELLCIVDSLDAGMFVWRRARTSVALPPLSWMHGLKRLFEWWFLRRLS